MDDQPQNSSGIRDAIKRLSSVLTRGASTATTTLKRSKSRTFNYISNFPSKDAVAPRSAFRDSRSPGILDRRVSFYDSLPCLDYGPTFNVKVSWSMESAERRSGLLLPAITTDNCSTDDHCREVEYDREQSGMRLNDTQPAARHDSSVEPVSLRRSNSARRSGTSRRFSANAERRRSCMDFTKAMMQENARSRSLTRPLSLLADKVARGQSPRPAGHIPADVPVSRRSSHKIQEQITKTDDLDEISHAYKAHVNRSLKSMQGHDKRGSAYVHESLVEMQKALAHAMAEITITKHPSTDDDKARPTYTHAEAPNRLSQADDSNASNDKTADAFSFDMPYDSAQPSAEVVNLTKTTHLEAFPKLNDLSANDQSEDSIFDPALMPLPLRIRPRHS